MEPLLHKSIYEIHKLMLFIQNIHEVVIRKQTQEIWHWLIIIMLLNISSVTTTVGMPPLRNICHPAVIRDYITSPAGTVALSYTRHW